MKFAEHYVDPRLVALYDIENPRGPDTDFYLGLAAELDARRVIDLGCGTGLLTRELTTGAGFTVDTVYGDWEKGPLLGASRVMIFVARRD